MKRILCLSGSRADYGLLEWPVKVLKEAFDVWLISLNAKDPADAFYRANVLMGELQPDCLLILGDRWEILQAAIAAHLRRVPIAHIGGGDVTLGSYDDAMRDCISRLAKYHFPTSALSADNLVDGLRYKDVYMVGNVAMDYILNADWRTEESPQPQPYVVVNFQPETVERDIVAANDGIDRALQAIDGHFAYIFNPNADFGSGEIKRLIQHVCASGRSRQMESMPHGDYLNLLYHAELFIGNSSSIYYECPALEVPVLEIGKRQQGRVAPTGDGKASERIKEVLCRVL